MEVYSVVEAENVSRTKLLRHNIDGRDWLCRQTYSIPQEFRLVILVLKKIVRKKMDMLILFNASRTHVREKANTAKIKEAYPRK